MKRVGACTMIFIVFLILVNGRNGATQDEEANQKIFVEIFLSPIHKKDAVAIQDAFAGIGIRRVRIQFHRLGISPQNIAIGKNIPAAIARLALRLAIKYNDGIDALLPEYRFFPQQIAIGSSAFDEKSQVPIGREALQTLLDPALTTEPFHALYRHLTGEDSRFLKEERQPIPPKNSD